MPSPLADAHIQAQARLRRLVERLVGAAWTALPAYDETDVPSFLRAAVPVVFAAQRQSAALTDAYIARALERQPLGVDLSTLTTRAGATLDEVYRRPFVTVWTALQNGSDYPDAVNAGLARATGMAAADVQLTSRATYAAVQRLDPRIRGYRRVADPGACTFCRLVNGAFVKSADAMGLHNHCGCGLEPVLTREDVTPTPEGVAVHEHGELGAVLADPAHVFTHV